MKHNLTTGDILYAPRPDLTYLVIFDSKTHVNIYTETSDLDELPGESEVGLFYSKKYIISMLQSGTLEYITRIDSVSIEVIHGR